MAPQLLVSFHPIYSFHNQLKCRGISLLVSVKYGSSIWNRVTLHLVYQLCKYSVAKVKIVSNMIANMGNNISMVYSFLTLYHVTCFP